MPKGRSLIEVLKAKAISTPANKATKNCGPEKQVLLFWSHFIHNNLGKTELRTA